MLTHDTVESIGRLVGFTAISFNGESPNKREVDSDGVQCYYGTALLTHAPPCPPLLTFVGDVRGHLHSRPGAPSSIYVLNLHTLRPTKKSHRQVPLPEALCERVRKELAMVPAEDRRDRDN